ncbi:hypothetical protein StoSoilB13_17190 [Arthrobacter sp. StoSoilB13]|nr:hypothetical protein StoSoilB13_17190 [Arthrobacter sp. StoSoilB13]
MVTWLNASVTGVSRSKIETRTTRVWDSGLISEIVAGRVSNGAFLDDDGLADLEVDSHGSLALLVDRLALLGLLFFEDRGEHGEDLVKAQRDRVVGVANEASDAGGVANGAPGSVGQVHADQDVTGDADAVDYLALRVLDLDDFFHRDLDFEDVIFHVQRLDAGLEVGLHAVFVTGVGVDDVPVTLLAAKLGLEFLSRIRGRCSGSGFQRDIRSVDVGVVVRVGLVIRLSVYVRLEILFGIIDVGRFGRSRVSLRLFRGLSRGVVCAFSGPIQLSLVYLKLLLRHLVSCFLIA